MTTTIAIELAIVFAAAVWLFMFVLVSLLRRKWRYVNFTPHKFVEDFNSQKFIRTGEIHPFEPRLGHYLKTSEVVITLASASLVFIPRLSVTTHSEWFAFSMASFGLCVLFLVLFMVILVYFYEDSLYFPTNYTVRKSAVVVALGTAGLMSFVAAYVSIAIQVANAVGEKTLTIR